MSSVSDRSGFDELEVVIEDRDRTRTVSPRGEIDLANAASVREPLTSALDDGFATVVLDLAQTTFIDSTGIAVALDAFKLAQRRGARFVVVPGPAAVHRVFVISGLIEHLPFADGA